MKSLLNIFQIWYHEIGNIFRDKGIMIFILFVPLAYPLLYSYVYTNEVVREVPVAVVDENNSPFSREFLRKMDASPDVRLTARCSDMAQAGELLRRQEVYGIVRIPESFTRDLSRGLQTPVGLYCDMSSMLYYKALLVSATNVSLDVNRNIKVSHYVTGSTDRQDEINKMPIDYDYVPFYNPQSGFAAFLIPPVLMLIIQQTLLLGIGMSTGNSRERYMGSVIPFHPWYKNPVHITIGKALPYLTLYIVLAIYMFTVVTDMFILPKLGHYTTFIAFIIPYLLACIFLAMVLSAFVYRREDSILLLVFLSVPMLFLSGLSWPAAAMPEFWKYISYLFPSTFGMNGYVKITAMGASLDDIRTEYMALWLQAGVYFILACIFYRRQIARLVSRNAGRPEKPVDTVVRRGAYSFHIGENYASLKEEILAVPTHGYETLHTFCNRRNTVEKVLLGGKIYVVKKYKRPTLANCLVYSFLRKNKARRAYEYALRLRDAGIETAAPVAYITMSKHGFFHTGWFISEFLPYETLGSIYAPSSSDPRRDAVMECFMRFTVALHRKGIFHHDYNPGNILFYPDGIGNYRFALIDINQLSFGRRPLLAKAVGSFIQGDIKPRDLYPVVNRYAQLREVPESVCRFLCRRRWRTRGLKRLLKRPIKKGVEFARLLSA